MHLIAATCQAPFLALPLVSLHPGTVLAGQCPVSVSQLGKLRLTVSDLPRSPFKNSILFNKEVGVTYKKIHTVTV